MKEYPKCEVISKQYTGIGHDKRTIPMKKCLCKQSYTIKEIEFNGFNLCSECYKEYIKLLKCDLPKIRRNYEKMSRMRWKWLD